MSSLSRREFLKLSALAAAGITLGRPLKLLGAGGEKKAKRVIQIWLWGGASHIDTFDPKPSAGHDYCGPYNKAADTNVDHIKLNPELKNLAKCADKYSIIRSMSHGVNAHETASYLVQTGHLPNRLVYPSIGAVVSMMKKKPEGLKVPPYIVLTRPQGRFSESGFLGNRAKPFCTGGDPSRNPFLVEGIVAKGLTDERQKQRRGLLSELDIFGSLHSDSKLLAEYDRANSEAYSLIMGDAKKLFDLSTESRAVRERYGKSKFGQSCLMARRLAEAGVTHVTINYEGWDTHKQHFQIMSRKLPEFDLGLSALLEDLNQRGLLDETIVICYGEFGRTPRIKWEAPWNGGRGHYGNCFSALIAGGGFKGGVVVGESCERGLEVVKRPVKPQELMATIYTQLGISPWQKMPNPRNLDVRIVDNRRELKLLTELL